MEYKIGQIFIDDYEPAVADWCNGRGDCYIYEIEEKDGHRRFQIVSIPEPTADEVIQIAKFERADAVASITVEVDGMTFDGDETAQDRMARAITMFNASGLPSDTKTKWVLADNTIADVTVSQLAQALLLAGQKQTELWLVPYEK